MPAFSLAVSRGPTTPSPKARYSVFLPPFGGRARSLPVSLAAFLGAAPTLIWPGSHTRWRYKGGYYPPRGAQTSRPQVAMGTALPAFSVSTIFPFGRGGPLGTGNLAVHQPIDTLDGQKRVRLCCGYDPSSGMLHGKPRRSLHAPRRGDHLLKHVEIIRYVALPCAASINHHLDSLLVRTPCPHSAGGLLACVDTRVCNLRAALGAWDAARFVNRPCHASHPANCNPLNSTATVRRPSA